MPRNFPDMDSLRSAAKCHKFRQPQDGEPEIEFRTALADHVMNLDLVESEAIRNGIGWDRFTEQQSEDMVRRIMRSNRRKRHA